MKSNINPRTGKAFNSKLKEGDNYTLISKHTSSTNAPNDLKKKSNQISLFKHIILQIETRGKDGNSYILGCLRKLREAVYSCCVYDEFAVSGFI